MKKMGIANIRENVLSICLFYFQVKSFMFESVTIQLLYIGESGLIENMQDLLFGTSTKAGTQAWLYKSVGCDGNSEEENSSVDEEPNLDEGIFE